MQRSHRSGGDKALQQFVGRDAPLFQRVEMEHQSHGESVGLRVDEAAPAYAFGAAEELLRGPLPPGQAEALVDLLLGHRVQGANSQSDLFRLEALVKTGLLGQERQRPVAGDDQRRFDDVVAARHAHSTHRSLAHYQPLDSAAGEQGDAGGDRLVGVPAIEVGPEQGEAGEAPVGGRARSHRRPVRTRRGLEGERGGRAFAGDGENPLGDRPLPRRALPEIGHELFGSGAVGHHAAEHVLGPRILAPLQQQDLGAGLCEPERRAGARGSRPDDDSVEAGRGRRAPLGEAGDLAGRRRAASAHPRRL